MNSRQRPSRSARASRRTISPGFATGIAGLHAVHFPKVLFSRLVQELQGIFVFQLAKPLTDCGPILLRQLRQFCNDFGCAHDAIVAVGHTWRSYRSNFVLPLSFALTAVFGA